MFPLLPSRCPTPERDRAAYQPSRKPLPPISAPRPMLHLRAGESSLFVELVQEATLDRKEAMVWVRPQLLVIRSSSDVEAISMAGSADMLWPAAHFQAALAEDYFPYLNSVVERSREETRVALRALLDRAWAERRAETNSQN